MTDLFKQIETFLEEAKTEGEIPLIVLAGPTASGKTKMSMMIARHFNGEIISADSMQVYRDMNIGTDKIDSKSLEEIPHHLINIKDPNERFTMADFQRGANEAIKDIAGRNKLPIIAGGTGLYLAAVVENYELPTAPPNLKIRSEIQELKKEHGPDYLHDLLKKKDPESANKIHPNNVRYVERALEIVMQTGEPMQAKKGNRLYKVFKIAIQWDREILYERINKRVDEMIEEGLIDEIKSLLDKGYGPELTSMQGLGYKEYIPFINREASLEDCVTQHKQGTRNFAKRQLSWFRKEDDIHWIQPEEFFQITQNAS